MVDGIFKISGSGLSSNKIKGASSAQENFLEALKATFAKETGKLVGTKLPGDRGVVFSPNPQTLLSLNISHVQSSGEPQV
ncbi:MAG: hypothetical protein KKC80_04505 [Candidatus Margulisbacteria bacterium]|nr:hypothetical protein [Candidatus Margulisiibacteriota bacterium]MBU1616251.1 hypothetical protein [Candidatus Margulisiibacteriota bacterium]MBU1867421.1 hypothetical protein [Candidatus Margulisiibacteriota bacterium]